MPVWVDATVGSVDQLKGLRDFLSSLYGWSWDLGTEDTGHYSIAFHDGRPVMGLGQGESADGRFTTYFATKDLEAAAARATSLGANVFMGPLEVTGQGSMALVMDPVGVVHGLWQADAFEGFGVMYEPNTPGWFDHSSADPAAAEAYYTALTGHRATQPEPGMRILQHDDQWFASLSELMDGSGTPRWHPIYVVDQLARARDVVAQSGGRVLVDEMPVPGSAICVFTDPVLGNPMTVMAAGAGE
jgi:uncharacterized protein